MLMIERHSEQRCVTLYRRLVMRRCTSWDDGTQVCQLKQLVDSPYCKAEWSQDGKYVLLLTIDGRVSVLDLTPRSPVQNDIRTDVLCSASWDPDGNIMVVSKTGNAAVVDWKSTRRMNRVAQGSPGTKPPAQLSTAKHPDSRGALDKTVPMYSTCSHQHEKAPHQQQWELNNDGTISAGQMMKVNSVEVALPGGVIPGDTIHVALNLEVEDTFQKWQTTIKNEKKKPEANTLPGKKEVGHDDHDESRGVETSEVVSQRVGSRPPIGLLPLQSVWSPHGTKILRVTSLPDSSVCIRVDELSHANDPQSLMVTDMVSLAAAAQRTYRNEGSRLWRPEYTQGVVIQTNEDEDKCQVLWKDSLDTHRIQLWYKTSELRKIKSGRTRAMGPTATSAEISALVHRCWSDHGVRSPSHVS
jgi:WD40 repeat protein